MGAVWGGSLGVEDGGGAGETDRSGEAGNEPVPFQLAGAPRADFVAAVSSTAGAMGAPRLDVDGPETEIEMDARDLVWPCPLGALPPNDAPRDPRDFDALRPWPFAAADVAGGMTPARSALFDTERR